MISGYVISLSAENRTAYEFAVSRFVRLYPALWFGVIFTSLVLYMINGEELNITKMFANMTLLNDYLGIANVDGVYWTLQAELKFYGCVFILVALGLFPYYKAWLTIWLALTVLYILFQQPSIMGWFISPGYSPFFIAGVTFYLIQKKGFDAYNTFILLVSSALCAYHTNMQAPGFIKGISSEEQLVASLIVLASMLVFISISRGWLSLQGSTLTYSIGALTYPLYLLHNSAGKAIIDSGLTVYLSEGLLIVLVTVLMLVASYWVFRFIEKPLARILRSVLMPKAIFGEGRVGS
jgi:peptidoglycan/LPS O-acetylase OafA/YrhL